MKRRFLIIRLGAIGDIIHSLPIASAIKDFMPSAEIVWIVESIYAEILHGNPDIDQILTVDSKLLRTKINLNSISGFLGSLKELKNIAPDVAIDPQGLIKSGFLSFISRAKIRVGFEQNLCRERANAFFSNKYAAPSDLKSHVIKKNLSLLEPLKIPIPEHKDFRFPLIENRDEFEKAESFYVENNLKSNGPILIVHPGGGWITKQWDPSRFAKVADFWVNLTKGRVLFSWGPGEKELVEKILNLMNEDGLLFPFCSIREIISLIRRGDFFLGGDTGPSHLAAALGLDCITLMGPTDPERNRPWGDKNMILYHSLACSECYLRKCDFIECMSLISVKEVENALEKSWGRKQGNFTLK
tara:strand:+ start:2597 stop:3667 length:1071 start_codon:yes stop_codon:yes gene_type:complete